VISTEKRLDQGISAVHGLARYSIHLLPKRTESAITVTVTFESSANRSKKTKEMP
jgi:hypothetical protein